MKTKILVLLTLLLLVSCTQSIQEQPQKETQFPRGISISPASFEQEDVISFFDAAQEMLIVSWAGDWHELNQEGSAPYVLLAMQERSNYAVFINTHPSPQDLLSDDYASTLVSFAQEHHPDYLGVGNEVNFAYDEETLKKFAPVLEDIKKRVHEVSPGTRIVTSIQYEWLLGLRDGLFGKEATEPDWQVIDTLNPDVIGISTYPGLYYKKPADIPDEYYTQIADHVDDLVAFTETGWFREGPPGWESSVDEQVAYINRFKEITQPYMFAIWIFMYDQEQAPEPFKTMSLREVSDAPWEAWKN